MRAGNNCQVVFTCDAAADALVQTCGVQWVLTMGAAAVVPLRVPEMSPLNESAVFLTGEPPSPRAQPLVHAPRCRSADEIISDERFSQKQRVF